MMKAESALKCFMMMWASLFFSFTKHLGDTGVLNNSLYTFYEWFVGPFVFLPAVVFVFVEEKDRKVRMLMGAGGIVGVLISKLLILSIL
jgi:hypothetical protein